MADESTYAILRAYLANLIKFAGAARLLLAGGLLLIASLFQGVSLLLLVPLLGLVGLGDAQSDRDTISGVLESLFSRLDISYGLIGVLGVFLLVIIIEAVFTRYRVIVLNRLNLDFVQHLRVGLFRVIGTTSWQYHSQQHSSESMQLLDNAVSRIGSGTFFVLQLFVLGFQALVYLAVAASLSIDMTLVMLATGLLLGIMLSPLNKRIFKHGEEAVLSSQSLYRKMVDFFGGLKLAKSYNRADKHIQQFEQTGQQLLENEQVVANASAAAQMWLRMLSAALLCVFVYIALTVMHLGVERLLVLIVVVNRLYGLFSSGQSYWQALLQALPSYKAYRQAFAKYARHGEVQPRSEGDMTSLNENIRLENVTFSYGENNQMPVLNNLSVNFEAKQITAITGESGSGKSTLADILMGLLVPDSGQVFIDDRLLEPGLLQSWREHVAYVPQEVFLFDGTIRSNMTWISDEEYSDEDIWSALDTAAAGNFIRELPDKLEARVGERGVSLSGGERQRIALARALLKKPDLLILDEATSSLDQNNETLILNALSNLTGEITIIVIAHRKTTLECAKRKVNLVGSVSDVHANSLGE